MMSAMFSNRSQTRTRSLSVLVALALACGVAVSACGDAPAASNSTGSSVSDTLSHGPVGATVTLEYQSYEPGVVTIHVGQSVEWRWADAPLPENVVFADGVASPIQAKGVWYRTFTAPGIYAYQCPFHSRMTAKVVVEP